MKEMLNKTEQVSAETDAIINEIIAPFCSELHEEMLKIKKLLQREITDKELEQSILNLANILYFTGNGQEMVGIRADISREEKSEIVGQAILQGEGSVAEKTAKAEIMSKKHSLVNDIYTRAYKKLKLKIESGYEMLNSLKKVLNKRCAELELAKFSK